MAFWHLLRDFSGGNRPQQWEEENEGVTHDLRSGSKSSHLANNDSMTEGGRATV